MAGGSSDLQAYLAAKYMSGAKADAILDRADDGIKRRKKKRKVDAAPPVASGSRGGLVIADDDGMAWGKQDEEDEEDRPVVEERRGQFKSKGANSWATIRDADPFLRPPTPSPEPEDEAPVVVSTTSDAPAPRGGLQSAADLRAEQERQKAEQERKRVLAEREREKKKREARARGEQEDEEDPNATVYRDASGRKIDMKVAKAEEAKRKREEMEREMAKMEWGKGLVQREDKERQKREAEALAKKGMARYADDADMNAELKEVERWNDPAANFLTKTKTKDKKKSKFPPYTGPAPPPNRFGIAPGYRWDGVDRSNGWEAKYMQKKNARSMHTAAAHAFSTEDM
ncbi:hypothetical protein JCM21900_003542 [Sporobolomyces salmonicolor]